MSRRRWGCLQKLICMHQCSLGPMSAEAVPVAVGVTRLLSCRDRPYDDLPDEAEEARRKTRRRDDTSPAAPRSAAVCWASTIRKTPQHVDINH
jgi:hypothetical protein